MGEICERLAAEGYGKREVLDALGQAAADGRISVEWETNSPELKTVFGGGPEAERICRRAPHWWNALAYEREWDEYPEYNDFLYEQSPVYHKKQYQWQIYEEALRPVLSRLSAGSRVLDIGGGVGRAAVPLAERGVDVTLVDTSPRALNSAWGSLARQSGRGYDLAWRDASSLDGIEDRSMDAALALEVICYVGKPEAALKEAVRCVRPGGWVAFSVENKLGAMAADHHLGLPERLNLLMSKKTRIDGELFVSYYSDGELLEMARGAGMESARLMKSHFTADGLFGGAVRESDYADAAARRRLMSLERLARELPFIKQFARASLVYGFVK
ncbi:MAG: methyltransferase domain-containing protein [bacterium]